MGAIVSFANQKGGVGKTTTAINVAAQMAKSGKKVLIVDLDPQGNATSGVGINKKSVKYSVYDVIIENATAKDAIVKTEYKNLSILTSNISLIGAEMELQSVVGREKRLFDVLSEVKAEYDYIFIDCPPTLGLLTINALVASEGVIIPVQSEFYALEGLSQLILTIRKVRQYYNDKLEITGILLTMFNGRFLLSSQVEDELKKHYEQKLFNTKITRSIKVAEAPGFGKPLCYFAPYSKGGILYKQLCDEIMMRI